MANKKGGIYINGNRYCSVCEVVTKELRCSVCHQRTRTKANHSQTNKKNKEGVWRA